MIDDIARYKISKLSERIHDLEKENGILRGKIIDIMHIFSDVKFYKNIENENIERLLRLKDFK